jgi:leucyl-tRNA synthetase
MWTELGHTGSLAYEPWPEADESLLVQSSYTLPVQVGGGGFGGRTAHRALNWEVELGMHTAYASIRVSCAPAVLLGNVPCNSLALCVAQVNGKMRGSVEVPVETNQDDAVAAAQTIAAVSKQLDGKPIKKVIFVPNKILNLIVGK